VVAGVPAAAAVAVAAPAGLPLLWPGPAKPGKGTSLPAAPGPDNVVIVLPQDPNQRTEMRDHKWVTYGCVGGGDHALDTMRNHPPNLDGLLHQDAVDGQAPRHYDLRLVGACLKVMDPPPGP
jgi:hypothetical protein